VLEAVFQAINSFEAHPDPFTDERACPEANTMLAACRRFRGRRPAFVFRYTVCPLADSLFTIEDYNPRKSNIL
jgi:hypothetical protein